MYLLTAYSCNSKTMVITFAGGGEGQTLPHSIVTMLCSVGSVSDLKTTISSVPNNNVTYSSCVIFVINPFLKTVRGID